MLRRMEKMHGFKIRATDDDIGHVDDFYFDDESWMVRYIVVETGPWLFGRRVLLSPHAAGPVDWNAEVLPVNLTKEQVENSPEIDLEQPVSRQHEVELHTYYGWSAYWAGDPVIGAASPTYMGGVPPVAPVAPEESAYADRDYADRDYDTDDVTSAAAEKSDHLRSAREVSGYHIQATDGEIGHLSDLFVSETEWNIRYALVDTRNWLPGRHVLIVPDWIDRIDWADAKVYVNVTRDQIKNSPEYDPHAPLDRGYETRFYDYYTQPYYWV